MPVGTQHGESVNIAKSTIVPKILKYIIRVSVMQNAANSIAKNGIEKNMIRPQHKVLPLRLKGAALDNLYAEVKARDRYHCQYCFQWTLETPHHIKTKGSGGADIEENLILLCMKCHRGVHDGRIYLRQPEAWQVPHVSLEKGLRKVRK